MCSRQRPPPVRLETNDDDTLLSVSPSSRFFFNFFSVTDHCVIRRKLGGQWLAVVTAALTTMSGIAFLLPLTSKVNSSFTHSLSLQLFFISTHFRRTAFSTEKEIVKRKRNKTHSTLVKYCSPLNSFCTHLGKKYIYIDS